MRGRLGSMGSLSSFERVRVLKGLTRQFTELWEFSLFDPVVFLLYFFEPRHIPSPSCLTGFPFRRWALSKAAVVAFPTWRTWRYLGIVWQRQPTPGLEDELIRSWKSKVKVTVIDPRRQSHIKIRTLDQTY